MYRGYIDTCIRTFTLFDRLTNAIEFASTATCHLSNVRGTAADVLPDLVNLALLDWPHQAAHTYSQNTPGHRMWCIPVFGVLQLLCQGEAATASTMAQFSRHTTATPAWAYRAHHKPEERYPNLFMSSTMVPISVEMNRELQKHIKATSIKEIKDLKERKFKLYKIRYADFSFPQKNKGNPHKGKKHKGIQNPKRQNSEIVEICQHLQMKMIPARGPQTKDSSISPGGSWAKQVWYPGDTRNLEIHA